MSVAGPVKIVCGSCGPQEQMGALREEGQGVSAACVGERAHVFGSQ
jgi:hypothetical protein